MPWSAKVYLLSACPAGNGSTPAEERQKARSAMAKRYSFVIVKCKKGSKTGAESNLPWFSQQAMPWHGCMTLNKGRHHREILPRSTRGVAHQTHRQTMQRSPCGSGGFVTGNQNETTSHSRCKWWAPAKGARASGGKVPPSWASTPKRPKVGKRPRAATIACHEPFHRDTFFSQKKKPTE